jgi:hypothetical protein
MLGDSLLITCCHFLIVEVAEVQECIDYGDSRDWRRRCSDTAERGGRQETVTFGSDHGLLDPNAYLCDGAGRWSGRARGHARGRYGRG